MGHAKKLYKEPDVINMIVVRQREKQPQVEMVDSYVEEQIAMCTEDIVSVDEND